MDDDNLRQLARRGVSTINPQSRDSGWLDWIERGTISWDDVLHHDDVTVLDYNLNRT